MKDNMQMCITIYIFLTTICSTTALFQWIEFDDRFDCIVGIVINGKPAGIGVFISETDVLTSANPLQNYLTREKKYNISVHVINGQYNVDKVYQRVNCMLSLHAKDRRSYWLEHGTDGKHCPLHDLVTINVALKQDKTLSANRYGLAKELRMPFRAPMNGSELIKLDKQWRFASFAYIDKQHVEESIELEAEFMSGEVLENCDEWIPREWGYFICIALDEDYVGIQSGAPLFHDDYLFGIASFSLKRMNKTILIFTDIRPYEKRFKLCRLYSHSHYNTYKKKSKAEV